MSWKRRKLGVFSYKASSNIYLFLFLFFFVSQPLIFLTCLYLSGRYVPDCNGNGVRSSHIPWYGATRGIHILETTKITIFSY